MEVELPVQLSVYGRVDVNVGLFSPQFLDMRLFGLEAIIF